MNCKSKEVKLPYAVITMAGTFLVPNHADNSFTFGTSLLY